MAPDELIIPEILKCPDCGREDHFPIMEVNPDQREEKLKSWAERAAWWFDKDGTGYCPECSVHRMRVLLEKLRGMRVLLEKLRGQVQEVMGKTPPWASRGEVAEVLPFKGPYPLLTEDKDHPIVMVPHHKPYVRALMPGGPVLQEGKPFHEHTMSEFDRRLLVRLKAEGLDMAANCDTHPDRKAAYHSIDSHWCEECMEKTTQEAIASGLIPGPLKEGSPMYVLGEKMSEAVQNLIDRGAVPGSITVSVTDKPDDKGMYQVSVSAMAPADPKECGKVKGGFTKRTQPSQLKPAFFDGDFTPDEVEEIKRRWADPDLQGAVAAIGDSLAEKDQEYYDKLPELPADELAKLPMERLMRACLAIGAPPDVVSGWSKLELARSIVRHRINVKDSQQWDCPNCVGFVMMNHEGGRRTCENCGAVFENAEAVQKAWEEMEAEKRAKHEEVPPDTKEGDDEKEDR